MRFVTFNDDRLGLLTDDGEGIVDLTDRLGLDSDEPLVEYAEGDYDAAQFADEDSDYPVEDVRIEPPVERPGKVIAAPLNYEEHVEEAVDDEDIDLDEWFSIEKFGYFLKAPSSVVGADDEIVLPFRDRRCDYEVELAFVMGEGTKDAQTDEAWDNILGYTILLDISVRGEQDRSNRKSYDTFTVIGPYVATEDEVGDPQNLDLSLTLNGEVRQDANTSDMIYTCADVIQYASIGATLEPGDVITTGTPSGVGALSDGETVHAEIENVGEMEIDVRERDISFENLDVEKGGQ